jgi:hypothetical protein
VAESSKPGLRKLREWPMFRGPLAKRRRAAQDGRAPPRVPELIMEHVPGTVAEKLAWLRQQRAQGMLDGDDPDEIAEAEALLTMLMRLSGAKEPREKQHPAPGGEPRKNAALRVTHAGKASRRSVQPGGAGNAGSADQE